MFTTRSGQKLVGITKASLATIRTKILDEVGISTVQICESAAYSMAMVVRYALGLSAIDGRICALVRDSLAGWIALATVRHLTNSGSGGVVLLSRDSSLNESEDLSLQLKPLASSRSVEIIEWNSAKGLEEFDQIVRSCHNVISGLFDLELRESHAISRLIPRLNELSTPVHCIEAPLGINVDTGESYETPLYASSTLSLGAPLIGLWNGRDFVGRHYLCDTSIPPNIYSEFAGITTPIFSEQPVIQIIPDEEIE